MKSSREETLRSLGSPSSEDWWNPEVSPKLIVLEDPTVRAVFDARTGGWIDFQHKRIGWKIQQRAELGQSFRAYATWKDSLFNPISGLACELGSAALDASGRRITFQWDRLRIPNGKVLQVSLVLQVLLEAGRLTFSGTLKNNSDATITTLSWPVLGDLVPPENADSLYRENLDYGTMKRTPLWPRMANERGYYGTNYPMQIEGKGSLRAIWQSQLAFEEVERERVRSEA